MPVDEQYLLDASGYRGHAERLIVAGSETDVVEAVREASLRGIPLTIAGAGNGITGARVPQGGWVLSLERLNEIAVHAGEAVVGPGALLREVHAAARARGQFYPPD